VLCARVGRSRRQISSPVDPGQHRGRADQVGQAQARLGQGAPRPSPDR
jgi:hypothetical protein